MLNLANKLSIFALLHNVEPALFHPQLQASRGEIAAEKDLAGGRGNVNEPSTPSRHMGAHGQSRHIDIAFLINLQEGEATAVKAASLEKSKLVRRRHNGVRVRRTTEGETQQRHTTDRALFYYPTDFAM